MKLIIITIAIALCVTLANGRSPPRITPRPPSSQCPVTLEHRPVCGTDGKDYPNPSSLDCAKRDKPDLEIKHPGPCSGPRPTAA